MAVETEASGHILVNLILPLKELGGCGNRVKDDPKGAAEQRVAVISRRRKASGEQVRVDTHGVRDAR